LWRNESYRAFFDYLDHKGGFFYERWGDAPVHSIAAALFLPKRDIHFFNDLGYFHVPPLYQPSFFLCNCFVRGTDMDRSHFTTALSKKSFGKNVIVIRMIILIGRGFRVRIGGLISITWSNPRGGRNKSLNPAKNVLCCRGGNNWRWGHSFVELRGL
jgi:hypothetical protein